MKEFPSSSAPPSLWLIVGRRLTIALACGLALAAVPGMLQARRGAPPATRSRATSDLGSVSIVQIPEINAAALLAEDAVEPPEEPLRFARPVPLDITPETDGDWEDLSGGARLWRLRIHTVEATDLNLGFTRFRLPPGATLHVSSEDHDYYEGPYDNGDNKAHGELWLPVVPGNHAVIELYVPPGAEYEPELRLGQVGVGYRDLFGLNGPPNLAKQGSCNIDVVCPEGDEWRDQIRSVAAYTRSGVRVCSGQMIADVPGSLRSFFLTAHHCRITEVNDATVVVYWNFQSPSCGQLGGGSLEQNQTGATLRASLRPTDFTLLELDEPPEPMWNVFYTGWDRSGEVPQGSVGIHHPGTDEKAISFNHDPLTTVDSCIASGGTDSHWRVDNWEVGTTEPGSSGSGLWDPATKLLVGFLSGGQAACGNSLFDCYGKFSVAWDGDDPSTRLRDWLDPDNTGVMSIEGTVGAPFIGFVSDRTIDQCALDPSNENGIWEPGETIQIPVTIRGTRDYTNVTGKLTVNTPGITVVDDRATWVGVTENTAVESQAPHFSIRVGESVACLTSVDYSIEVSADEGGPFTVSKSGVIGSQPTPNVPLDIPDLQAGPPRFAVSTALVGSNVFIDDLEVYVKIRHSTVGDLRIVLTGPDGTAVTLLDRPGYPAAVFGCGDRDINVVFSDSSSLDLESHCPGTIPWVTGPGSPTEPLAAFDGKPTQGTWTLTVQDLAGGDSGVLEDWELRFDPPVPPVCNACGDAPPGADVTLSKQLEGPVSGARSRYLVTVRNAGPSPASGVMFTDVVAGARAIVAPQGCAIDGSTVSCDVGDLLVNQEVTYSIDVSRAVPLRSRSSGAVISDGRVMANEIDPQPQNNLSLITIGNR